MTGTKTQNETSLIDLIGSESRFSKFNEAIKATGLTTMLAGPDKFTVFAPTNEAFAGNQAVDLMKAENLERSKNLLLSHIVPGKLMTEALKKAQALRTEAGQDIKVVVSPDLKEIKVASAKLLLPSLEAVNGCLYPVDALLQTATANATA